LIDLHTHTIESDGSYTPRELVQAASQLGLRALGICDHDVFAGYDQAVEPARQVGLPLVCGIELSTRLTTRDRGRGKSVHLLGYFLHSVPSEAFRGWLAELQASRRERNRRLVDRLKSLGVDIELAEVESLGRSMAGRPHFARLLVHKGYVPSIEQAFRQYLDESAKAYVERDEPSTEAGLRRIRAGGGVPSLAHPVRLGFRDPKEEEAVIVKLCDAGLQALEVYHSDHGPRDVARYKELAIRFRLAITGGSDFHGAHKPNISLGTGLNGNLTIPEELLDRLRDATRDSG
jgi:predicted metal-dependent phosphoesterase TrpH